MRGVFQPSFVLRIRTDFFICGTLRVTSWSITFASKYDFCQPFSEVVNVLSSVDNDVCVSAVVAVDVGDVVSGQSYSGQGQPSGHPL